MYNLPVKDWPDSKRGAEAIAKPSEEMSEREETVERAITELREKIQRKESIPGYQYNPQYDNWLIARRQPGEMRPGGRGPQQRSRHQTHWESSGPERLYVASQNAMLLLVDDAVSRYRTEVTEYERRMEVYRAVERERATYASMTDAMKEPEDKFMAFMASDTGKRIEHLLTLRMSCEQEDDEYPGKEEVDKMFSTLNAQLAAVLPDDMRIVKYDPPEYMGTGIASVEWLGRIYKIALITITKGEYGMDDWRPGVAVLLPELPERPVPPLFLDEGGKLTLNHENPAVEVKISGTENEEE